MFKFGLIGAHLSHSCSPKIHSELFKSENISATYDKIEILSDNFKEEFTEIKNSGYDGLNITIPYKEIIIPYLDYLSKEAKYIGAVNTVLFKDGKSYGYNTDYHGFISLLNSNEISAKGKEAVILGAGGVSNSVVKALLDLGIYDITIVNRSKQNFHSQYTVSYEFFNENISKYDILINCTPVGMFPNINNCPIEKSQIKGKYIIDLIYNPKKTLLLQYAEELGFTGINGEAMLLAQAKESQKIWLSE